MQHPQTKMAVDKLSSFGPSPILLPVLWFPQPRKQANNTDYSSPRLLQGEMNGNPLCETGPIWPRRGENLGRATCLHIPVTETRYKES